MNGDTVENMRTRAKQCRRLADAISDREAARILRKMADEIEADIERLRQAALGPPGDSSPPDQATAES